jgi:hypothetical protein
MPFFRGKFQPSSGRAGQDRRCTGSVPPVAPIGIVGQGYIVVSQWLWTARGELQMFRVSIRELLLVTLAVAMGVAWFVDRRSWQIERETNRREKEVLQATLHACEAQSLVMERVIHTERTESEALIQELEKLRAEVRLRELAK